MFARPSSPTNPFPTANTYAPTEAATARLSESTALVWGILTVVPSEANSGGSPAASLPKIAPYLYSPNAEIRQAALEGMLQMGQADAVPIIMRAVDAAIAAGRPREAKELLEAADYLKLPTANPDAPPNPDSDKDTPLPLPRPPVFDRDTKLPPIPSG